MMKLLSWLFWRDKAIQEKEKSIADNARDIEGIKPIVEEAIRRTDDEYYRRRSLVGKGKRRLARVMLSDLGKSADYGLTVLSDDCG